MEWVNEIGMLIVICACAKLSITLVGYKKGPPSSTHPVVIHFIKLLTTSTIYTHTTTMNIFQLSLLLAILLKCVIASESGVREDVIKALEEDGFESIKR